MRMSGFGGYFSLLQLLGAFIHMKVTMCQFDARRLKFLVYGTFARGLDYDDAGLHGQPILWFFSCYKRFLRVDSVRVYWNQGLRFDMTGILVFRNPLFS